MVVDYLFPKNQFFLSNFEMDFAKCLKNCQNFKINSPSLSQIHDDRCECKKRRRIVEIVGVIYKKHLLSIKRQKYIHRRFVVFNKILIH